MLVENLSAHCSEVGTRCNESARFSDSLMLRALASASVGLAAISRLGLRIVNYFESCDLVD